MFGKVVGGLETLSALEAVETDNKDRPIEDLILIKAQVRTPHNTQLCSIKIASGDFFLVIDQGARFVSRSVVGSE